MATRPRTAPPLAFCSADEDDRAQQPQRPKQGKGDDGEVQEMAV